MAAITGTKVDIGGSAFAGHGEKIIEITCTPESASDTITLTKADHEATDIQSIISAELTAGIDANLLTCSATHSGLVITLVTYGADGAAATDWTGASAKIIASIKM